MRLGLKKLVEKIPYPAGKWLARVPFGWRLGAEYGRYSALVSEAEGWRDAEREAYAIENFRKIFEYAREKFPFYRELYQKAGVGGLVINSLSDIKRVPVITKAMIRDHVDEFRGAYRLNTGGTTGTPFAFYVDKNAWAREWAHMHRIWSIISYDYRIPNLAFRGKNIGDRKIVYNPVHNEFLVNTYLDFKECADDFLKLIRKHARFFVHGYPSAVYNWLVEAEKCYGEAKLRAEICAKIGGLLLHSEFPYDYMKAKFRQYGLKWMSWYGHSEMCVLAYDNECNNEYRPFLTYGFAEVADGHLIGTSWHNVDMPLIRYDTGDIVREVSATANGLCKSFAITEGRNADFVLDRTGKRIPLTSLIFGRHHKAFDFADHIQIRAFPLGSPTQKPSLSQNG